MRVKNSIYNVGSNFIIFIVKAILMFIVRSVLIAKIAQEYIGLNGLLTNVLSILSLSDLGISSAIGFSLYKPLADNDEDKISRLMTFYKKAYSIIGISIFIMGLCIIPMLPIIVKEPVDNLLLIYFLFLINTCSLYFISYKDVLITADQKAYKLTKINLVFTLLINVFEIIILYLTNNFICYLLIQFILNIVQRIFINVYISKQYKNIKFDTACKLDNETRGTIFKNIKAMFFHKVGDCMINATDNIIISSFISINMVSIYSNYLLVTTYLTTFASMIYNGILASLGNFVASESDERKYEIFRKTNFLGFSIFSYFSILLINVFEPFIKIIANEHYLFNFGTTLLIVLNFYITGLRIPTNNIKQASGLFDIDKYTPIIQSIINIVVSIVLSKYMGINGVLIGTFVSSILPMVQRPCIVYKHILKKKSAEYFWEYLKYFVLTSTLMVITIFINSLINFESNILTFVQRATIVSIIYGVVYYLVYGKKEEFLFYKDMVFDLIRGMKHAG